MEIREFVFKIELLLVIVINVAEQCHMLNNLHPKLNRISLYQGLTEYKSLLNSAIQFLDSKSPGLISTSFMKKKEKKNNHTYGNEKKKIQNNTDGGLKWIEKSLPILLCYIKLILYLLVF